MALNDEKLKADLKDILKLSTDGKSNANEAFEKLAEAVINYVKSAGVDGLTADGKTVTGKLV